MPFALAQAAEAADPAHVARRRPLVQSCQQQQLRAQLLEGPVEEHACVPAEAQLHWPRPHQAPAEALEAAAALKIEGTHAAQ
jgi:hypothetical protein